MESFDSLFRNWDGEIESPMIIPRRVDEHKRAVTERANTVLDWMLPKSLTNVRDVIDTSFADSFPRFPVRYWLAPKESTPTILELIDLWKAEGYRPLSLHEGLDFEETLRELRCRHGYQAPQYKRIVGGTHAFLRTRQGTDLSPDGAPIFADDSDGLGMFLHSVDQWMSDDYLFLLTPLTFEEKDIVVPELFREDPFFTTP